MSDTNNPPEVATQTESIEYIEFRYHAFNAGWQTVKLPPEALAALYKTLEAALPEKTGFSDGLCYHPASSDGCDSSCYQVRNDAIAEMRETIARMCGIKENTNE